VPSLSSFMNNPGYTARDPLSHTKNHEKTKLLKVLHVIPAVSPKYGGPSHALWPACRALQAHGVAVQVASTDAEPGGHMKVELEASTTHEGVPAIFFHKEWSEAFKFSRSMANWLERSVTDFDVVEIHGVFSHAFLSASRACFKKGVPYVIRPLGHLERWALDQKPARKKMFLKLGGMSALRNAAAIHYTSASERHSSEETLALNHGVTIPFGIRLEEANMRAAEAHDGKRPYVLVLSRLLPTKGIDVLLKAFIEARNQPRLSEWQLIIAGAGPPEYEALLKRLITESKSDDSVLLTGWLEGDAKAHALANASLLALPSHHESFGLCVVEAMAYGVPVLVGPHVGLATEIQNAGAGWISPIDAKSISGTLAAALVDHEEMRHRGEAGRKLSRKFGMDVVAEQLIELYESVLR
jgi:glycosyltransferase involved in cell wall biosynthesis